MDIWPKVLFLTALNSVDCYLGEADLSSAIAPGHRLEQTSGMGGGQAVRAQGEKEQTAMPALHWLCNHGSGGCCVAWPWLSKAIKREWIATDGERARGIGLCPVREQRNYKRAFVHGSSFFSFIGILLPHSSSSSIPRDHLQQLVSPPKSPLSFSLSQQYLSYPRHVTRASSSTHHVSYIAACLCCCTVLRAHLFFFH